jgi:t-SNARE complex subunit (syntaxin)
VGAVPIESLLAAVASILAASITTALAYFWRWGVSPNVAEEAEETRKAKIRRLNQSLTESAELIEELNNEILANEQVAQKLKLEVVQNRLAATLSADQRKVVKEIFASQLEKSNRKVTRDTIVFGFIFFVFGSLVTFVVTWLFSR